MMAKIVEIPVYQISDPIVSLREEIDKKAIRELAASIKAQGIIHPLVVRKRGDHYQIVAGHRRLLAAKEAKLEKVPCIIMEYEDKDAILASLVENLQRKDINPLVEARTFQALKEEYGMEIPEIAYKLGKSREYIDRRLNILKLPPTIQEAVKVGALGIYHANMLFELPTDFERELLAHDAIERRYTVVELRRAIDLYKIMKERLKASPKEAMEEVGERIRKFECTWCHILEMPELGHSLVLCEDCYRKFVFLMYKEKPPVKPSST